MSKPYKEFEPKWIKEAPNPKSFRALMKWGDPAAYKAPKEGLYKFVKDTFKLTDDDFKQMVDTGEEIVDVKVQTNLTEQQIKDIKAIVGDENATIDDFERIKFAYGKTMIDIMRLRKGIVENVPDIVVYPAEKTEIEKLLKYANENNIKFYVHAGGSSVTRGTEAMIGPNMMIEISKRFNKVIEFNEVNQTITVQPGIFGPALEKILNEAPQNFGTSKKYTCGHFPQSFEYSCVGGWVVTRGSGQNSTYYGDAADIVLSEEYVTLQGTFKTENAPGKATGPNIDQIMMGSEGCYGILTEVTLKVFNLSKKHTKFSFMFPTWDAGMAFMREVLQGEFGKPSAFRLSDAEETDMMSHMYGIIGSPLEPMLNAAGYKMHERCLCLGFADGEIGFQKNMVKNIKKLAKKYHGMYLTGYVTTSWEHGRFSDPYLRDTIQDYGVIIDTLECAVNWDNMPKVHDEVRAVVKAWPNAVCTCHISHSYPQGANLYFIFIIVTTDLDKFTAYHATILEAIQKSGASLSHHHGIGKLFAPYLEASIGKEKMDILKALKKYFDPNGILNPGGTLGLDDIPKKNVKE